ncbi:MAG: hypothetical protein ACE5GM_06090, partial [bacterium]
MEPRNVVVESFDHVNSNILKRDIKKGKQIYVVEPFVAYHYKKVKVPGFPQPLPEYVERFIENGTLKLITAESLEAKNIYRLATNRAVEVIETIFPVYREKHEELFQYVSDTLNSSEAENVFKKELCKKIAEFYSVNIMLDRIARVLGSESFFFYPSSDIRFYNQIKALFSESNQAFFDHPKIRFPLKTAVISFFNNRKRSLSLFFMLSGQTLISGLTESFSNTPPSSFKKYQYGVAIISPLRQLANNSRGPNFLVDKKKIKLEDAVYFLLTAQGLDKSGKEKLSNLKPEVIVFPKPGKYFSHFTQWKANRRFT